MMDTIESLRAELATIKARVHDAYLREPSEGTSITSETGDHLIDRLHGIYTIPVNDGAGLLNGKDTFTRRFPTLPLNLEAADEIVRLRNLCDSLLTSLKDILTRLPEYLVSPLDVAAVSKGWAAVEKAESK